MTWNRLQSPDLFHDRSPRHQTGEACPHPPPLPPRSDERGFTAAGSLQPRSYFFFAGFLAAALGVSFVIRRWLSW